MKTPETKTHIEIEGCILTETLIDALKRLQKNENEDIQINVDSIMSGVRFIASRMCDMQGDELTKAAIVVSDLSNVCDELDKFRKP